MKGERGLTLMELLVAMALLTTVLVTATATVLDSGDLVGRMNAAADGVRAIHRSLERIEADVRGATSVAAAPDGALILVADGREVSWAVEGGVLSRRAAGRQERVASGIASFRAAAEEGLWRVTLVPAGRTGAGRARSGVTALLGRRIGEAAR